MTLVGFLVMFSWHYQHYAIQIWDAPILDAAYWSHEVPSGVAPNTLACRPMSTFGLQRVMNMAYHLNGPGVHHILVHFSTVSRLNIAELCQTTTLVGIRC